MALSAETRAQFLETISRFVRERLVPAEDEVAENDEVPEAILEDMRRLGLFGLSVPENYGGLGLSMEDEALVCFELGKTSPAFRSAAGTNIGIGSHGIIMFGTEDQKKAWLPKIATGEIIASFALTEPNAGSDAAAVQTSATRDGDCYILNGTKRYITNAGKAHIITVMARSDRAAKGAGGISSFIVPTDLPGVTIGKPEKKMGQQGAHACDVYFDDCRVPAANLLGEEGQGFYNAMRIIDRGRLHISALCVGIAERLIADSLRYALERRQFGQAIAEFQLVQAMLADAKTEAYAARCMVMDAARRRDDGLDVATESSCCKLFCTEMVGRVADRAVQIFGGAGYIADYGIERFYRDVRLFRIVEGTTQIQQLIIARNLIKQAEALN